MRNREVLRAYVDARGMYQSQRESLTAQTSHQNGSEKLPTSYPGPFWGYLRRDCKD